LDLKTLVESFPRLRLAAESDEERLRHYFHSASLSGQRFGLRVLRMPNFSKLLKFDAEKHFSFFGEGEDQKIIGMASATFRPAYLEGAPIQVGFLRDMRISFDRRAVRLWRDFLEALTKHSARLSETGGAAYFLTTILDDNRFAQRALVSQSRSEYLYEPAASFRMVNLVAKKPRLFKAKLRGYTIQPASSSDRSELVEFLERQNQAKTFGYCFKDFEFERRLKDWEGFSLSSFWLARDASHKIVTCFAPWNVNSARQSKVEKLPWTLRFLSSYLPLSRFMFLPRLGQVLDNHYLTHLEFDSGLSVSEKSKLLAEMIIRYQTSIQSSQWQLISFCDFDSESLRHGLNQDFALQTVPLTLYLVRHRDTPPLSLPLSRPGFEMALW